MTNPIINDLSNATTIESTQNNNEIKIRDIIVAISKRKAIHKIEKILNSYTESNVDSLLLKDHNSPIIWKSIVDNFSEELSNIFLSKISTAALEKLLVMRITENDFLWQYADRHAKNFINSVIQKLSSSEITNDSHFLSFLLSHPTILQSIVDSTEDSNNLSNFLSDNTLDDKQNTFLHLAVKNNNIDAITIVLKKLSPIHTQKLILIPNNLQETPLLLAAGQNTPILDLFFNEFNPALITETLKKIVIFYSNSSATLAVEASNVLIQKLLLNEKNIEYFLDTTTIMALWSALIRPNSSLHDFAYSLLKKLPSQHILTFFLNQDGNRPLLHELNKYPYKCSTSLIPEFLDTLDQETVLKLLLHEDATGAIALEQLLHREYMSTDLMQAFLPKNPDHRYQVLSHKNFRKETPLLYLIKGKNIDIHNIFLETIETQDELFKILSICTIENESFLESFLNIDSQEIIEKYFQKIQKLDSVSDFFKFQDKKGNTVLHYLPDSKNSKFFINKIKEEDCIEQIFSITNNRGNTFLTPLIKQDAIKTWKRILPLLEGKKLTQTLLTIKDEKNRTVLHQLAHQEAPNMTRVLIKTLKESHLLDTLYLMQDDQGKTFFTYVINHGNIYLWEQIHTHINSELLEKLLSAKNKRKKTILHTIASGLKESNQDSVDILKKINKPDILINLLFENNNKKRNFMYHLVKYNKTELWNYIKELLNEEQLKKLITIKDPKNDNILHLAAQYRNLDLILLFLENHKEDIRPLVRQKNSLGKMFLHILAEKSHKEKHTSSQLKIINQVFTHYEKLDELLKDTDDNGSTILHYAYSANNQPLIEFFVEKTEKKVLTELLLQKNLDNKTPIDMLTNKESENCIIEKNPNSLPQPAVTNLLLEWTLKMFPELNKKLQDFDSSNLN